MEIIVSLLLVVLLIIFIAGLLSPSIINRIKTDPTRKDVLKYVGIPLLLSFLVLAIIVPPVDYYKLGEENYAKGDYKEAVRCYSRIKSADKNYPEAVKKLAASKAKADSLLKVEQILAQEEALKEMKVKEETKVIPLTQESEAPIAQAIPSKIEVNFLNVKYIDGQYRYFFNYKNIGDADFKGEIRITLITQKGTENRCEALNGEIKAGGGGYTYFDKSTGMPSTHGEYGIAGFEYVIKNNSEEEVGRGSGGIPDKNLQ